ncbi:protein-L-isoaspartate O-methyltransferase family protein [Streptomyces sp. NPDC000405]|uniref:protein-L-isoaspartate O-methyltransferase family protein n=1 Tax=Streptomyces sp. NPDC000405 TaxID=3161033 RepID=UPI00398D611A
MAALSGREQAALRGLLDAIRADNGSLELRWENALEAAPRHLFVPPAVWAPGGDDTYEQVDSQADADRWFRLAYASEPVITQVNDGQPVTEGSSMLPSSSLSDPAIVVRMLTMLDPRPGQKILEIGTGAGWNTALLSHAVGPENVLSVEVDPALTEHATHALAALGLKPRLMTGDGFLGWPSQAPFRHVLATCAVNQVPRAWIEQTETGGTILTPWNSPWCDYGLLHLTVHPDRTAQGRFSPHSAFMLMRGQRHDIQLYRDVVSDDHLPTETTTTLSPWDIAGSDLDAQFALGLLLPDLWHAWHPHPVDGVDTRLWIATTDARSWAAIDHDGMRDDRFTVWQHGPRRLLDEITSAWSWFTARGRPGPGRFGLTATRDQSHYWLDNPGHPLPGFSCA